MIPSHSVTNDNPLTLTQPGSNRGRFVPLLLAGIAIASTAINLRTAVTGFSPLLELIGGDLGFGVGVIGILGTIPAASFGAFGFFAPTVTRRFGLERTAAAAMTLTALALTVRAGSPGTSTLIASTVLALAGIGAANVVIVPLVKAWFPERIAMATSAYLILMQAGQFIAPLLAVPAADWAGWRFSVGVWAAPALLAAVAWVIVTLVTRGNHRAPTVPPPATQGRQRITRSSFVCGLVVLFAMMSVSNYSAVTWLPAILHDAGAAPAVGGAMVALYSLWGVAAAFTVPRIVTRMRNPFVVVVVCSVALVVGYGGLMLSPLDGLLVWVSALGIGVSTFPLCMTLINKRSDSPATASRVSGVVQGIGYALACVGPISLGLLREGVGSWTVPLLALVATVIPTMLAGWFACRPQTDGRAATISGSSLRADAFSSR